MLLDDLARQFSVLGSGPRLTILQMLTAPRRLMDIQLAQDPARGGRGFLARQSVQEHVQKLVEAGFLLQETTPDRLVTYRTDVEHLERVLAAGKGVAEALARDRASAPPQPADPIAAVS